MIVLYIVGGILGSVLLAVFGHLFLWVVRFLLGFAGRMVAGAFGVLAAVVLASWATGSL